MRLYHKPALLLLIIGLGANLYAQNPSGDDYKIYYYDGQSNIVSSKKDAYSFRIVHYLNGKSTGRFEHKQVEGNWQIIEGTVDLNKCNESIIDCNCYKGIVKYYGTKGRLIEVIDLDNGTGEEYNRYGGNLKYKGGYKGCNKHGKGLAYLGEAYSDIIFNDGNCPSQNMDFNYGHGMTIKAYYDNDKKQIINRDIYMSNKESNYVKTHVAFFENGKVVLKPGQKIEDIINYHYDHLPSSSVDNTAVGVVVTLAIAAGIGYMAYKNRATINYANSVSINDNNVKLKPKAECENITIKVTHRKNESIGIEGMHYKGDNKFLYWEQIDFNKGINYIDTRNNKQICCTINDLINYYRKEIMYDMINCPYEIQHK